MAYPPGGLKHDEDSWNDLGLHFLRTAFLLHLHDAEDKARQVEFTLQRLFLRVWQDTDHVYRIFRYDLKLAHLLREKGPI